MIHDPPMVKKKGVYVCIVCGESLNEVAVKYLDPFCRTQCANEYHGFVPASTTITLGGHQK